MTIVNDTAYTIHEVADIESSKAFLKLPVRLYKNEKKWIRPLDKDIEGVFDPKKNKYFRHGDCKRWILLNRTGECCGRIAAFVDWKQAKKNNPSAGGIGFFECINDQKAAFMLFDKALEWLSSLKLQAADGPVNFGERHQWWGLLVEGFFEPNYSMPYNFSYYRSFFENYGFQLYFKQYTFHRSLKKELDPLTLEKANKVMKNPGYSFGHIDFKNFNKHVEDFRTVYNKGWAKHAGVNPISERQAKLYMDSMKKILDKRLLWFAYYKDQAVGFFLMIPELNQIFKHLNGSYNLFSKLKILYIRKFKSLTKALGLLFGVVPEHQGKGLESAIITAFSEIAYRKDFEYTDLEMNWIGDFNPRMIHVVEQIGATVKKVHHTYRYILDPEVDFKRADIL